jgi:glycerophosphoryl diester phosphodiesterase
VPDRPAPFAFTGPAEIVAHRGYSARAPENTLIALELALRAGADAVEFDLHAASDGTPVLFHDATLNRTTDGTGPVSGRHPEQLARLDAGSWFGPAFTGEPIPTLEATLRQIGDRVGRVYAEVKGYRSQDDLDRILEIVAAAGLADRTVFISMDWGALDRMRETEGAALIGYIVEEASRARDGIERARGDPRSLLDFDAAVLLDDPTLAERSHAADIPLATWTVDTAEQADALRALDVPRITTNEVEALREWKQRL